MQKQKSVLHDLAAHFSGSIWLLSSSHMGAERAGRKDEDVSHAPLKNKKLCAARSLALSPVGQPEHKSGGKTGFQERGAGWEAMWPDVRILFC